MTTTPPVADVEPKRFRRAPVITEAVQWDGTPEHAAALIRWMESDPERGDVPEADSAYWVEHEADRDRYVMGFRSFGLTDYALAGDWVTRASAGVYVPNTEVIFRTLHTPVEEPRPRFSLAEALGASGLVGIIATLANTFALWYAWHHHTSYQVPVFALAASLAVNSLCIASMSAIAHYCRKRVTR